MKIEPTFDFVAMSSTPDTIPLFPLSHGVFPDGMLRLQIFEPRYLDLIKRCQRDQTPFGVVWLKQGREVQTPGDAPEFHRVGCMAHIRRLVEVQPALLQVVCQGGLRFELTGAQPGPYGVWQGEVRYWPADPEVVLPSEFQGDADQMGQAIAQAQRQGVSDRLPWMPPYRLDDCGWLANRYAEVLPLDAVWKLTALAEMDPLVRMRLVAQVLEPPATDSGS